MPGAPDSAYVAARRVLLDALEALSAHLDALVLVGAQAIYLQTGEGALAVAPYTTDADLAVDPNALGPVPALEAAMRAAGFVLRAEPGIWFGAGAVEIDLLVPEALGGGGRRGARLGTHGNRAARKARGLEATLVDNTPMEIRALEERDDRRFEIAVAGPAALLVAKLHKLAERQGTTDRLQDKDALDVLRLLRETETELLAATIRELLSDERSNRVLTSRSTSSERSSATSAPPAHRWPPVPRSHLRMQRRSPPLSRLSQPIFFAPSNDTSGTTIAWSRTDPDRGLREKPECAAALEELEPHEQIGRSSSPSGSRTVHSCRATAPFS